MEGPLRRGKNGSHGPSMAAIYDATMRMSTPLAKFFSVDSQPGGGYSKDMLSPARIKKEAKESSDALREALEHAVKRSGVELKELSARLGRADGYFSHLFKGRITLTVEHVIAVLTAVGVKPKEFFASFYGIEPGRPPEDDFDARVLKIMERYGIKPIVRDDAGGTKSS